VWTFCVTFGVVLLQYAGCDLLYATKQFLHHHVMTEHTSNTTKNAPCQWLNCDTYLDWSRNQQVIYNLLLQALYKSKY